MTEQQHMNCLIPPEGPVDVILDTDAFNEIDDQFAISYMIRQPEKYRVRAICAAPFFNHKVSSPLEGMELSHQEIMTLLRLAKKEALIPLVKRGSGAFLSGETEAVPSEAASFMAECAMEYTADHPLYIIAIGAITNVASALLLNPEMKERCVIIWLGGRAENMPQGALEFNMMQDIAAARVVFGCGAPVVQLPCRGVVDRFHTTKYELEHWLRGKNELCDFLLDRTIRHMEQKTTRETWSKTIWDVTAVAWLQNQGERYLHTKLTHSPIPQYDMQYSFDPTRHLIRHVYWVDRDALYEDLFRVLAAPL